ncbi:hypothetical protein BCR34DRAFT_590967 [Clohesyomyces aquaticus]|uniref:SET domain-containing protein n=1 Tax=Clohesyomyces aquaticus TaxID=1231657 RepID=A0A1Y1Z4E7_9PLEO|nr:hypothetical protein BCR34DRAFT_590967 [Clohesyomyces aquaticus]
MAQPDDGNESSTSVDTIVMTPRSKHSGSTIHPDEIRSERQTHLDPFEIRVVHRNGEAYPLRRLYATKTIPAGTRLLAEKPLIMVTKANYHFQGIADAFVQLSEDDQKQYLRMELIRYPEYAAMEHDIDSKIELYESLVGKEPESEQEALDLTYLEDSLSEAIRSWRVNIRFHSNSTELIPDENDPDITPNTPAAAVFPVASCIQQSCIPNLCVTFNKNIERMTIQATHHVAQGEEFTVSSRYRNWYEPLNSRIRHLQAAGNQCRCPACDPSHPDFLTQEKHRANAKSKAELVERIVGRLMRRDGHPPLRTSVAVTESNILDLLNSLVRAGCRDSEIARWRKCLAQEVLPFLGKWTAAVAQAKLTVKAAERCWGEDHPELEQLREMQRRAEKKMNEELEKLEMNGRG